MENRSEHILSNIRQIIRAINLHSKSLAKRYGLTSLQLLILKELHEDNSQTIGRLSKKISLSQATVTSILDRLEKYGFVTRIRQQQDKRKVNVELSAKAQEVLLMNPSLIQEDFTSQFENLAEWEQMMLVASLQRIALMMNTASIPAETFPTGPQLEASESDVQQYLEG